MKAKEKALKHLSEYDKHYPPGYSEIDPLIKPLCELLTENGYLTMHSCSTHTKVQSFKTSMMLAPGQELPKDFENDWIHHKYLQWYILFIATLPITDIRKVVQIINKKYNYGLYYYKAKSHRGITRRWMLEKRIDPSYKDKDIYELNKNVYLEFKNYFDSKES